MSNFVLKAVLVGLLSLVPGYTASHFTEPSRLFFTRAKLDPGAKPAAAPKRWRGLIGEYGPDNGILYILEKDGRLCALFKGGSVEVLEERSANSFLSGANPGRSITFTRAADGRARSVTIEKATYARRQIEPENDGAQLHITPLRPVPELIKEALAAEPPKETGDFRTPDLVELAKQIRTVRLDIRYATTNNLFGTVFYSEPRAFMQRPAADALARVDHKLSELGYGLLIHDAYRPWYVTKVFWDATPQEKKIFVADPAKGSRHNRGAAVDLTLYDLKTKKPVEMVGTYDETTDRSYPNYPGGTSLQRWHRDRLREVMEFEGFTVYEAEWWHFDYKDWQLYPIGNEKFDEIVLKK